MSGSQNSINELLVGLGAPQVTTGNAKGTVSAETTGNDFAALLGMLSGIGVNAAVLQGNPALGLQTSQTVTTPSTNEPGGAELFASQLIASLEGQTNLLGVQGQAATGTAQTSNISGQTPSDSSNNQRIMQLLSAGQLSNVSTAVSQIPDGKYKVLSASITDGKLDLQLVNKDDGKSEVHISIPVELLQKPGVAEVNPFQPLTLRSGTTQTATQPTATDTAQSLTDLFSQLNVTDVAISKASLATAQSGQSMTAISFSDVVASSAPLLSTVVPTAQLKTLANVAPGADGSTDSDAPEATDITPSKDGKSSGPVASFVQSDSPKPLIQTQVTSVADAQPMFRTAAVRINSKVLTQDSSTIGKLLGDSDKTDASLFKTDLSDSTLRGMNLSRPVITTTGKLEQPAVRITLPQNLSSLLDGHGRSINIKLEPDYLGPARLNLSMRGESLTAKLTVETQQAKSAVENSITQLTDQLAKAGIKVDYFDVSMRGGSAGQQQAFQRPQDWFSSNRPRVRDFDDDSSADSITQTDISTTLRDTTYLNGRGVNLFA